MRRNKGFTLIELMIVIAIIAIIAAIAIPGLLASQRASNERNASASLKTTATAEADFRANDRDGNKVQDFWTGDVGGLYCVKTVDSTGTANKLIELSIAAADSITFAASGQYNPAVSFYTTQGPKAGYWYFALVTDDSTATAYGQTTGGNPVVAGNVYNNSAFGFIAYPDAFPSSGKIAFILNENNTMFKRQLTAGVKTANTTPPTAVATAGFSTWPTDLLLKTYWSKMD